MNLVWYSEDRYYFEIFFYPRIIHQRTLKKRLSSKCWTLSCPDYVLDKLSCYSGTFSKKYAKCGRFVQHFFQDIFVDLNRRPLPCLLFDSRTFAFVLIRFHEFCWEQEKKLTPRPSNSNRTWSFMQNHNFTDYLDSFNMS